MSDHGRALCNPNMGWTMHFYSNQLENYGSKLAPSDTLDDFPGLGGAYLRIPWAFVEPEEGHFIWETLDTPAQRWIDKGMQVSFRISALESWMYKATPQWVFDAGAKGYDAAGWAYEPDYDDPVFLEKVENFVRAMAERYNGNPNVAFVDIGHMGMWGEGHSVATTPKHGHSWSIETQKKMIDLYCRHFTKTQLAVSDDYAGPFLRGKRFPIMDYAFSKGVTMRDDSILVSKAPEQWYHDEMAQLFWPAMPVVLEHEHYGLSKKRGNWDSELLVESVEAYHASYMSIHWWPREELAECREAIDRINSILRRNDNVQSVTSVAGFSILSGNQSPNSGLIFIRLKDWSQRKMTAGQITTRLNEQLYYEINSAQVYTFGPPSIPGLGPGSGFTIMIQDKGGNTPGYLADYTDRFIAAARQRPEIATISTTFQADEPQKAISIDNEKVLKAGISLDELHSQISSYLGGMYVNNFNRFGRMYQTYIQAEDEYRLNESKLDMFYLTNDRGESVPLSAFITVRDTTGPQFTNRFNLYRAAGVTGLPASEYSTAQAMKALEEVADEVLPSDMGYAWSNMSYQEAQKSGAGTVFLYAVVFVFLILAALYESWTLPLSILLGIPFAVFGALAFTYLGHLFNPVYINDIFLQVSLIMLIGLAAKNAILIVEYARDKFDEGMDLQQAALEGAKLRVRPVVMTAVAFLMGVLPLILATGSNAVARNIMGLALFGGMLVATVIGLYAYPALFVLVGRMSRYEQKRKTKNEKS